MNKPIVLAFENSGKIILRELYHYYVINPNKISLISNSLGLLYVNHINDHKSWNLDYYKVSENLILIDEFVKQNSKILNNMYMLDIKEEKLLISTFKNLYELLTYCMSPVSNHFISGVNLELKNNIPIFLNNLELFIKKILIKNVMNYRQIHHSIEKYKININKIYTNDIQYKTKIKRIIHFNFFEKHNLRTKKDFVVKFNKDRDIEFYSSGIIKIAKNHYNIDCTIDINSFKEFYKQLNEKELI